MSNPEYRYGDLVILLEEAYGYYWRRCSKVTTTIPKGKQAKVDGSPRVSDEFVHVVIHGGVYPVHADIPRDKLKKAER